MHAAQSFDSCLYLLCVLDIAMSVHVLIATRIIISSSTCSVHGLNRLHLGRTCAVNVGN